MDHRDNLTDSTGISEAQAFQLVELFASLGRSLDGLIRLGFAIEAPPAVFDAMRRCRHPQAAEIVTKLARLHG